MTKTIEEKIIRQLNRVCTCISVNETDKNTNSRAFQTYTWTNADNELKVGRMYYNNTTDHVAKHGMVPVNASVVRSVTLKEYDGKVKLDIWYEKIDESTVI